jgi:hypothetical protein
MLKTLAALTLVGLIAAAPSTGLKYTVHMEARPGERTPQDQMAALLGPMMVQVFPAGGLDQVITIGEKATRTEQRQAFAGLPAGAVTISRSDGSSTVLDPAARTFWKPAPASGADAASLFQQLGLKPEIKVAKTGLFETIEGMRAEKVAVTIWLPAPNAMSMSMDLWFTDAIQSPAVRGESPISMLAKFGLADMNSMKDLNDGRFMLKQVLSMFGVEIVTTVKDVTKPDVAETLFEVPGDFKEIAPPRGAGGGRH